MKNRKKSIDSTHFIAAILYLVFGILFIAFRTQMLNWALTVCGALALLYGIYLLVQRLWLYGALYIALGLALILGGWLFLTIVLLIFGILILVVAIVSLIADLNRKPVKKISVAADCVGIVVGGLLVVSKWYLLDWLFIVIGAVMIVNGVLLFFRTGNPSHNAQ